MTTQAEIGKIVRDFLKAPSNPALAEQVLVFLAHASLPGIERDEAVLADGLSDDADLCPRCLGTLADEVGKPDVLCRTCKTGTGINEKATGSIPKPTPGPGP